MGVGGGFRGGGDNICIVSCEGQSPHDEGGGGEMTFEQSQHLLTSEQSQFFWPEKSDNCLTLNYLGAESVSTSVRMT